jgi:hypothetical protein
MPSCSVSQKAGPGGSTRSDRGPEHLTGGDLVVDVGQHVEHLVVVRHGVQAQIVPDLTSQNLEISSQESWRRRWHRGLVACQCSPVEWMKLIVGVGDVGQSPKVEDLA